MVLVTGASSGIGREIAKLFAASGARVIVTARRTAKLESLVAELDHDAVAIPADLSSVDGATQLAAELEQRDLSPDIVVNNAGVGLHGEFLGADGATTLAMLRLNVNALTELTHRLLPAMVQRGRGGILNVASTAAFQPGPKLAVYYATKAYVLSFTEALHHELKPRGVHVSCLCPGPTVTEFAETAGMSDSLIFRFFAKPVGKVARAGVRGIRRNKAVVVPGFTNKLGTWMVRLMPRAMTRWLVSKIQ